MDRIQKYILSNLSTLFISIFMPLFAIASVIFSIKLATYTAVIQLSLYDMAKLYLFVLPEIFSRMQKFYLVTLFLTKKVRQNLISLLQNLDTVLGTGFFILVKTMRMEHTLKYFYLIKRKKKRFSYLLKRQNL